MRVDNIHEKDIYIYLQPVEGGEELVFPSMHKVVMFHNVDSKTFDAIERQRVSLENTKPIITMAALSRQRDLSEPAKDNIRSRIASTIQSASITDSNLTKDEQQALKRLKNDKEIVILPADKGRVTVVMDKTDYYDKMDALANDKQTYELLKRDPTPALQRKLNNKLLTLKN